MGSNYYDYCKTSNYRLLEVVNKSTPIFIGTADIGVGDNKKSIDIFREYGDDWRYKDTGKYLHKELFC